MSNALSRLVGPGADKEARSSRRAEVAAEMSSELPLLAEALHGGTDEGVSPVRVIPGFTLMIFLRDDGLGFSLSADKWPQVCFGRVADPTKVLDSIEAALNAGECGWRDRK